MSHPFTELSTRIRDEIIDLDSTVDKILKGWEKSLRVTDEHNFILDGVALNLHGFYSGVERLFELIARHVDQAPPAGEAWHRTLLAQMGQEVANLRPAVIGTSSAEHLDEFRRFRHLVRNVYTINLVPEKMIGLIQVLPDMWVQLKAELLAFADFLDDLTKVVDVS